MPWKQDIWQAIRQGVSCLDVAPLYGYHPNSGGFIPCPFHHERTGSCKLYPGDGGFHCFGCGAHGDVIDFVAGVTGQSRIEAAKDLNQRYSLGLEFGKEDDRPRKYDVAGYYKRLDEAEAAIRALNSRADQPGGQQDKAVAKILELVRQHRVAYHDRPPAHILDTGDPELIRPYLIGNVYAIGGRFDFPGEPRKPIVPASKWDVFLLTLDRYGTFGEEMDAVIDIAEREGKYTPLKAMKNRRDETLISKMKNLIHDEIKEYNHE